MGYEHHPTGVSLARDYRVARDFGTYWERQFPVVFVLDQQKLVRSRMTLFPRRDFDGNGNVRGRESEEMVLGNIAPLDQYLISINIAPLHLQEALSNASYLDWMVEDFGPHWEYAASRQKLRNAIKKFAQHPLLNRWVPRVQWDAKRSDQIPALTEAPIADYAFIDRSEEPHPEEGRKRWEHGEDGKLAPTVQAQTGNSFPPEDLRALRNPKWHAKLIRQFAKSPVPLNLYLLNAGAFQHTDTRDTTKGPIQNTHVSYPKDGVFKMSEWTGTYREDDFEEAFGFLPPNYDQCINVLLTNNWGDGRVPLTPWIVAHRVVHALASGVSARLKGPHYLYMEDAFQQLSSLVKAAELAYFHERGGKPPLQWNDEDEADFFQALGTFGSARNRKVVRRGEFFVDVCTQTLLFGKPKFNLSWCTDPQALKHIDKLTYQFQLLWDEALYHATGMLVVL
jgi:hypothetical protein